VFLNHKNGFVFYPLRHCCSIPNANAGFEPAIFCSLGGHDATPPNCFITLYLILCALPKLEFARTPISLNRLTRPKRIILFFRSNASNSGKTHGPAHQSGLNSETAVSIGAKKTASNQGCQTLVRHTKTGNVYQAVTKYSKL
jgi:hypothetical protein